jgi:hypothetical protein
MSPEFPDRRPRLGTSIPRSRRGILDARLAAAASRLSGSRRPPTAISPAPRSRPNCADVTGGRRTKASRPIQKTCSVSPAGTPP